ncbi:hypothetical protein ACOMHN_039711 [Nucella lapillus]
MMAGAILTNLPPWIMELSDKELFDRLRRYKVSTGPIVPTTRSVYQRKLYALETGKAVEAHSEYPPADYDHLEPGDKPQVFRTPPSSWPRYRAAGTERTLGQRLYPGMGGYPQPKTRRALKTKRAQAPVPGRPWISWLNVMLIIVVIVTVIFLYLVFKNMEPDPDSKSNIPYTIDMQDD